MGIGDIVGAVVKFAVKAGRTAVGKAVVGVTVGSAATAVAAASGVIPARFSPDVILAYAQLAAAIGTALASVIAAFHHQQDKAA